VLNGYTFDGCLFDNVHAQSALINANNKNIAIRNCTIVNCSAAALADGNIFSSIEAIELRNSILRNNNFTVLFQNISVSTSYNMTDFTLPVPGPGNLIANPLFTNPAAGDYSLRRGSPAIDSGDSSAVPLDVTTDILGNPRRVDDPLKPDTGLPPFPIVDRGAFEFQPPPPGACSPDLTTTAIPGSPGYGILDGNLGTDDFFYYLNIFANGC